MKRTVADVMTRNVVTVDGLAPFKQVVRLPRRNGVSALPVVDEDGTMLGIVSEADLILKEDPELEGGGRRFEGRARTVARAKAVATTAWELMTAPVVWASPDQSLGEAARLMYRRGVKRLPVLDADRRIVGIVSRVDLLDVFLRSDDEIAEEVRGEVIGRTLWMEPDTIRIVVHEGVVTLEGQVERRSLLPVIERLVGAVEGVVAVDDRMTYANDDDPRADLLMSWSAPLGLGDR
jgi:CBS domain-containing protein